MTNTENQSTVVNVLSAEIDRQKSEIDDLRRENHALQSSTFAQDKYTTYLELTRKIAYSANLSANAEEAIRNCLDNVCEFTGWEIGHCFFINRKTARIESSGLWYLKAENSYVEFQKVSEQTTFVKGEGLPGRVVEQRQAAWIANIHKDENFPRLKLLPETELKSAAAFPVMYGDNVCAILEFFSSKAREPDKEIMDIMAVVGLQLGRALEREEASNEFHASNEQLMGILNIAPEAIITIDINQRIKIFNPGAEAIFGHNASDVIGKNIGLLVPERHRGPHGLLVKQFGKSKSTAQTMGNRAKVYGIRKNGEEFPAEASIAKLVLPESTSFLVTLRDITKRTIQEKALLKAKEDAEAANRAKSEFLANMSHELRTPLNAISGFSEVIKDKVFGDKDIERYVEYAGNIFDSSKHLLNLINDILDLSAVESGKIKAERDYIEPSLSIAACRLLVEERARVGNISLNFEIIHKPHDRIYADQTMFKQIIINLLTNSIKYNQKNGSVTLISDIDGNGNYLLKIADTGIGISEENLSTALARFGKITKSFDANGEGTGLGLTLCNELVTLHGGTLNIDSKVNVGTTVTVRLPSENISD